MVRVVAGQRKRVAEHGHGLRERDPVLRSGGGMRLFAPEGRALIARGGAQRNPWQEHPNPRSPGGAAVPASVAPPGLHLFTYESRGCAALHPWLLTPAPHGAKNDLG